MNKGLCLYLLLIVFTWTVYSSINVLADGHPERVKDRKTLRAELDEGLEQGAISDKENVRMDATEDIESADKLIKYLPGEYVHIDMVDLMGESDLMSFKCPASLAVRQVSKLTDVIAVLNISDLAINAKNGSKSCRPANPSNPVVLMHYFDLSMMGSEPESRKINLNTASTTTTAVTSKVLSFLDFFSPISSSPLLGDFNNDKLFAGWGEPIIHKFQTFSSRQQQQQTDSSEKDGTDNEDDGMEVPIRWYAMFPNNTMTCPGFNNSLFPDMAMYLMDAKMFYKSLLRSFSHAGAPPPRGNDKETMFGAKPTEEERQKQEEETPAPSMGGTLHGDDDFLGRYFFVMASSDFSCMYVPYDVAREIKALLTTIIFQENTGQHDSVVKINLTQLCPCDRNANNENGSGDHFPTNILFQIPLDSSNNEDMNNQEPDATMANMPSRILKVFKSLKDRKIPPNRVNRQQDTLPEPTGAMNYSNDTMIINPVSEDLTGCKIDAILTVAMIMENMEKGLNSMNNEQMMDDEKAEGTNEKEMLTSDIIIRILMNKYYQEISGIQNESIDEVLKSKNKTEQILDYMKQSAEKDTGLIIVIRSKSRCGSFHVKNDMIVLLELYHIIYQLQQSDFYSTHFNPLQQEDLFSLALTDPRLHHHTVHIFNLHFHNLHYSTCTYTSSSRSIAHLQSKCNYFLPLGSYVAREMADRDMNMMSKEPVDDKSNDENMVYYSSTPVSDSVDDDGDSGASNTQDAEAPSTVTPSSNPSPSTSTAAAEESESSGFQICFPGIGKVKTAEGDEKSMTDLAVGDVILDGYGQYSRVLAFVHSDASSWARFIQIQTSEGDIILSHQHYVTTTATRTAMKSKMFEYKTAASVTMNDKLISVQSGEMELVDIISIKTVHLSGLFNPVTESGSIAVKFFDGSYISSSCFTKCVDISTSFIVVSPLRWLNKFFKLTIPFVSWTLRNGSKMWAKLLPLGTDAVEIKL